MRKKNLYIPILSLALFFALSSCEEVIEVDLNSADPVLVVEGYMELNSPCRLRLTYTTDYFHQESPVIVDDAEVILSDANGNSETLRYLDEGIYKGQNIFGKEFSEYSLSINTGEEVYSGFSSLMPVPVFDSVRIDDFPFGDTPPGPDFPGLLTISFHNDPEREEYFMLRLTMNGEAMDESFSLASDKYTSSSDEVEYTTVIFPSEDGDTLSMEVYAIDADTYRYYTQLNEAISGGMAMSSTPYNPASNMGADILGYFMARSRFDTTLVVQLPQ